MVKRYIKILVACSLMIWFTSAAPDLDDEVSPSIADYLHFSKAKYPGDYGWLPDLTGLPNEEQIFSLTNHVVNVMLEEKEEACLSINFHLRKMILQHFVIYQHMANAQNVYFNEKIAHHWAHLLAMILKESSGDPTNITGMSGRSISTYQSKTDLHHWMEIFHLTQRSHIRLNAHTNFGLTQISANRLYLVFHLARQGKDMTEFLKGKEGAATPGQNDLNTALAVRRLIWFYQGFAQGRISQTDHRIPFRDIHKSEFHEKYHKSLQMALLYCGTPILFREGYSQNENKKTKKLENIMESIAYCNLGNLQTGFGRNEFDERCFAAWVTLCPNLNIDIATITPLDYFATRDTLPRCKHTFERLIIKKPKP